MKSGWQLALSEKADWEVEASASGNTIAIMWPGNDQERIDRLVIEDTSIPNNNLAALEFNED